jgi:SWI/SNF-related matrix-associated actin-dependent regulator of chromatin subfamily A member 5
MAFTPASAHRFASSFDLTRGSYDLPFLTAAQALLAKIMLRRTKATVELSVPPREETTVFVPLTEAQRFWTYRLLTRMDAEDLEDIFDADASGAPGHSSSSGEADEGRMAVREHIQRHLTTGQTGQKNRASIAVHYQKDRMSANVPTEWKRLMNLLMQLRKVCDQLSTPLFTTYSIAL